MTDQYEMEYLRLELSRLRCMVRYLAAGRTQDIPILRETGESFDWQWAATRDGDWATNRPELKTREPRLVPEYTGLPREWFQGKRVLDAGCGSGRWSWALASLGAEVTGFDISEAGVSFTQKACQEFGDRVRVFRHDVTRPLTLQPEFDLVWCFGVLHHTGDTYGAFRNIARLVRPGGYIFIMLYGEPDGSDPGSFAYYSEVEKMRRATAGMSFRDRFDYIKSRKGDEAGGWFDAVSPSINDTYAFFEIATWLRQAGFEEVRRTIEHPNHHVVAHRS